ncbi:hypothetical protein SAMN04487912_104360 [Arthrobacter sp. cf158]|uniref:hypothetical protein n=1 Tax=Arthrobacter sp. cf158 TaxID=1761744 RepID=UPI00089BC7FF|nr:hypothetical protein [Arthrobacter sp. cf158]SDW76310.1 hypothetical protein SAMN04487912_104360 [Arthrobacter sp. cf158]
MRYTILGGAKVSRLISEAGISRGSQKVIASVMGLACVFVIVTAIPSGVLLVSAGLVAVIALLTVSVLRITVTIEATDQNLTVRCRPFYSKTIPLQDIVDAAPAPSSSMIEGFGVRYLGQRTWGLLVGGPAIVLETPSRTWLISTPDPEFTAASILAHARK